MIRNILSQEEEEKKNKSKSVVYDSNATKIVWKQLRKEKDKEVARGASQDRKRVGENKQN